MPLTPRQAVYLGHMFHAAKATGRLGFETAKLIPKAIRAGSKNRVGSAGLGFVAGTYVGYRAARGVQDAARNYVFGSPSKR